MVRKCKFNIDGRCGAYGCYSDEKCSAKDKGGTPKYITLKPRASRKTKEAKDG